MSLEHVDTNHFWGLSWAVVKLIVRSERNLKYKETCITVNYKNAHIGKTYKVQGLGLS